MPTPGSTTATWTPSGMCGSAKTSVAAPSRIEKRGIWWLMSMIRASGAIWYMTPRQTAGAAGPKSVANVITGRVIGGLAAVVMRVVPGPVGRCRSRGGPAALPWLSAMASWPKEFS